MCLYGILRGCKRFFFVFFSFQGDSYNTRSNLVVASHCQRPWHSRSVSNAVLGHVYRDLTGVRGLYEVILGLMGSGDQVLWWMCLVWREGLCALVSLWP